MAGSSDYMRNYRTPPRSAKRARRSSTSSAGVNALLQAAADISGYGTAYRGAKLGIGMAKKFFNAKKQKTMPKKGSNKKGYSGYAYKGSVIKRGKKISKRTKKRNGKLTSYGIAMKGVVTHYEFRKIQADANSESVMIGHTSMPQKHSLMNLTRALFKALLVKMGIQVSDFGRTLISAGFRQGDQFGIIWYNSASTNSTTATFEVTGGEQTFDSVVAFIVDDWFTPTQNTWHESRLDTIFYTNRNADDQKGFTNPSCQLNLVGATVHLQTTSQLKVQNVTVETNADNEADDVTRVPLEGTAYTCKGNNVEFKNNRNVLPGMFDTHDEIGLYQSWQKQNLIQGTNTTDVFFLPNSTEGGLPAPNRETSFYRTAERPKPWELTNCGSARGIVVQPGHIRTSIAKSSIKVAINYLWRMLMASPGNKADSLGYNDKLGITKVMYLEKSVGRAPTDQNQIKLWVHLDFRQTVYVQPKTNYYTIPITFQKDF